MKNADILILAASEWLGKIASSILPQIKIPPQSAIGKMMQGFLGINPAQYNVWNELGFLLTPTMQSFVEPQLRKYLASIPDESIKDMAMTYADALLKQAQEKGAVNMFGVQLGPNTFEGLKGILNEKFNNSTPISL
ncbi:MAG: hypothetical protein J6U45_06500 [Alistipes sp.]|nr:hypothetical protein [Alistipes sp.]